MKARTFGPVFGFGLALAMSAACADPPDHPTITVTVVQGKIHVSEETADLLASEGGLAWTLPTGSGYQFPRDGIVVASPPDVHDCGATGNGQGFHCKKLKHLPGAKYKYTVTLVPTGSGQAPEPLDPFILHHN